MKMKKKDRNGFTLLEVIIFAGIFGIVVTAVYMMYATSHTTFTRGENKVELQQSARVALGLVANEMMMAGYDPSDALTTLATSPIVTADADTVTFIADVDGNNVTDQVRYRLVGDQVLRDSVSWTAGAFPAFGAGNTSELADRVATLDFTYFDFSGDPFAAPVPGGLVDNIRLITVGLTTQDTAANRQETFTLTTDVRLRNILPGADNSYTYQFDDKDGVTLTREFTRRVTPGALADLNLKTASALGVTPPEGCLPTCYGYDINGASDPASVPPEDLGWVGDLDEGTYGSGTDIHDLVLQ